MRNFFRTIVMSMVWMLFAGSCTQGVESKQDSAVSDSVSFTSHQERIDCDIYAEMPEESMKKPVGEWLDELLGGYFTGEMDDLQAMVDFYGKAWVDTLHEATVDIRPDASVAYEARMEKAYETDKIVTYTLSTYLSLGGAHPTSGELGATFRKSDGKRLTWDIVRHDLEYRFDEMKQDVVRTYFGTENDEQLERYLGCSIWDIPNPKTPPFFMENGIVFIYQQYEIAGYAAGMPGDTIPYERLKPLMTEQAKKLTP